jgi:fimbrial isopeptide formation D2 family protein/LPXTG-motif cell wall-anchored protein
MKKTRKFAGITAATLMAACLAVPMAASNFAYADTETGATITISETASGHTYSAYQIFAGTYSSSESGTETLSDITWGTSVGSSVQGTLLGAIKNIEIPKSGDSDSATEKPFADAKTPADIADILATNNTNTTLIKEFEKVINSNLSSLTKTAESEYTEASTGDIGSTTPASYGISGLADGYYFVSDSVSGVADYSISNYIINVVGGTGVEIAPKSAKPSVDKEVQDEEGDAEEGSTDGWGESADHQINESFKFKLTATLEANNTNYDDYSTYEVIFNDTMSKGVVFEEIESVTIYWGESATGTTVDKYAASTNENGYKVAKVSGNKDTDITSNITSFGGTAETSWKLTIADILKYAGNNKLSSGAKIEVIYKAHLSTDAEVSNLGTGSSNTNIEAANTNINKVSLTYSNNPNASTTGTTPEDTVYVLTYKVNNIKYANSDESEDNRLAGAVFELRDSGDNLIKLAYDGTNDVYYPDATNGAETITSKSSESNTDKGSFNIIGLDAGTYTLKETTAPAGFNKTNKGFTISAIHKENSDESSVDLTLNSGNGTITNKIVDKSGSTLPSTGGIGTTLFYVGGGCMVGLAGVFLITKKRMSNREK